MAGINISFVSDVRSFLTGTRDIERAMDDVGDALDDVARDAARRGDDMGDAMTDAGREAERASERMERAFRADFDKVADHAKDAGRKIERTTRDSMDAAGSSSGDFKREAVQNVSETASSFDGSMDDIAGMVQGTLGGLADLPGVGLGVAAVGALGGVVYNMWKAEAERIEARIQEMFDAMVESGANYLTQAQVQDAMKDLYDDDGKMDAVREAADKLGMTVESVATAYVTAGGARDEVQARAAEAIAAEQEAITALREEAIGASRAQQEAIGHDIIAREGTIASYQSVIDMINGQGDAEDDAAARAEEYRRAVALAQANVRGEYETTKTTQATTTQAALDDMRELATAINGLPQAIPLTLDMAAVDAELAKPRRIVVVGELRNGQAVI